MSWPKVRLGDVCDEKISRIKSISAEEIEYVDIASIDNKQKVIIGTKRYLVDAAPGRAQQVIANGDVLISTVRPNLNAVAIVEIESRIPLIASTGFCVLRAKSSLDAKFLYYFSQTQKFIGTLVAVSEKASYPSVTDAIVKDVEIPLPPLAEQKKIVEKVEKALKRVDALKAQFERMEKSAADYFRAALAETFAAVKGEKVKLGDVCDIVTGKKDVNQGNPIGRYPFFTCAKTPTRADTYSFDCEALLIAGNGDVGHVQKYSGKFEVYQRTYVLSGFKRAVRDYVYYQLNAYFKDWAQKNRMGNTMPYIKMGVLSGFEFSVPDESVQCSIVATLDVAKSKSERMVVAARRGIEICGKMRKAILAEAFQ